MIRTIRLTGELTFDDEGCGEDATAQEWFRREVLFGRDLTVHCAGEVGDVLGPLRILKFKAL